jgi:xylulokinase
MSLLSIDMGSSSCKAVAFACDGRILAEASRSYTPQIPRRSWAEMSPDVFWQSFCEVTREIALPLNDPLEVVGISSHGETFVAVGDHGEAVRPAILNMDNRAVAQANWFKSNFDPKRIFEITGLAIHPMYPIPKILWLRENEPEIFRRVRKFLAVPSYLLACLGLEVCVDYTQASRFLAFDVLRKCWSDEILDPLGLSSDCLAKPVPTGTVAGYVASSIARDLGLREGVAVVIGGHDQPCAALGMGVVNPGRVSASLGTYECLLASSDAPSINESAYAANLNTYCHVVPDRYVTLAYFPSGIMLDWFLKLLRDDRRAKEISVADVCQSLETNAPVGPTGLLVTPHLLGSCNPDFDPAATGVISGLRPAMGAAHIYKGILEGIACEFATMAELLRRLAGPFRDVYVTGGGCRSQLGLELRAAMSGCRLHRMRGEEAVCLGTAILAGVGAGKYKDIASAIEQLVSVTDTIEPDPERATDYRSHMKGYQLLYSSLAGLRDSQCNSLGDQ